MSVYSRKIHITNSTQATWKRVNALVDDYNNLLDNYDFLLTADKKTEAENKTLIELNNDLSNKILDLRQELLTSNEVRNSALTDLRESNRQVELKIEENTYLKSGKSADSGIIKLKPGETHILIDREKEVLNKLIDVQSKYLKVLEEILNDKQK